jgi:glutathione S-transferase
MMKLYITEGSPYARIVRVAIIEKGLQDRVEIIYAQTRKADSPYYAINPSGRVPYLIRDDGAALEESAVIVDWLDQLDGKPMFTLPSGDAGWDARRLEALARGLMDGLAVWSRENARAANERSPTTIKHEAARGARMADVWEKTIEHAWMQGALASAATLPPNMAQITLACALGMDARNADWRWRPGRPRLSAWFERFAARPSFIATAPPAR